MRRISVAVCDWDGRTKDLAEAISKTVTERVYLCVEDRHVLYRQDNVHEAITDFMNMGLEVILDPWGVANMFAGETVAKDNYSFIPWLKFAETTMASGIMLDEPLQIENLGATIRCAREFTSKDIHLAIEPYKLENLDDYLYGEKYDELSVSTYLFGDQVKNASYQTLIAWYDKIEKIVPKDASVWVQTWDLPAGTEWIPTAIMDIFDLYCKYDKINIWAWDAFRTVSSKCPANPDLVWNNILHKIQN